MPPLNLKKIQREIQERPDANRFFLLCEGTNTEPGFLEKILTNANYLKNGSISFVKVNKTENDSGVTDLKGLIKLANQIIENKENHFSKKKDKVVLIFDLDQYSSNNIDEIKTLIEENKNRIIFVYTNPAIELFLLLCTCENAYDKYISPNVDKILKNDWVISSDGKRRRFIADLFFTVSGVDSKKATADFTEIAGNIQFGINQEKIYLTQNISGSSNKLISNFGIVLEKIKDNDVGNITYRI